MKHIQSDFVVNATDSKLAITTERMNELDRSIATLNVLILIVAMLT